MKRFGLAAVLVAMWILLWGDVSPANLISGIVVSAGLLAAFPGDRRSDAVRLVVRPLGLLRLVGHFLLQLVVSNVQLTRTVLSGRRTMHTGVVICPLQAPSTRLLTVLVNMLVLAPGTMPVDLDLEADPPVLYLHVLDQPDHDAVRHSVAMLEARVLAAFTPVSFLRHGPTENPS
jgi:multicomponent Na+:H+ antiporter subunit E